LNKLYLILFVSSLLASLGQAFFKLARGNILNFYLYLGLIMYAISTLMWVYTLKYLPLSKVYPFTFLTFAFVLLISVFFFKEEISLLNLFGILLIVMGVVLSIR